jgi:zinc transporter ZupT
MQDHILPCGRRVGGILRLLIGITIHNIPEGIAVGAGYMRTPEFGFLIALGIALHNIPEGIATALPLSEGGMSRRKSFGIALFSGLVEPIGALTAALFLTPFRRTSSPLRLPRDIPTWAAPL